MTTILRNIFYRSQHHEAIPSAAGDEDYINDNSDEQLQQSETQLQSSIHTENNVRNSQDGNESVSGDVENWSDIELDQNSDDNENEFVSNDVEMGQLRRSILNNDNANEDNSEANSEDDNNLDASDENYDAVYRSIFDLQEEMRNHSNRENDEEDSVRLRNIMMVTCLIPVSIFILLSLSATPDPVAPPTDDQSNDTTSDTSTTMDDDGNYQLFSILFFMSFMNILCAFLERAGANSATHTHVTIPSTSIDENGETVTAASASLNLMSFEAQLTAAILESRRVQLLELLGRTDEIHPQPQNTGVSEEKRNAWCHYDFQFDSKQDPELPPTCSICLCEYEENEKVVRLPCNHEYHANCIESWTSSHIRCPLCNYDLETDEAGS